jgi:hypothetical protein
LTTEVEDEPPRPLSDVALLESDLQTSEDEASVSGRVENNTGGELTYIEAIAQVYDGDGNVLGDEYTNETGIPEGETWSFSVEFFGFGRIDEIVDHDVVLDATA